MRDVPAASSASGCRAAIVCPYRSTVDGEQLLELLRWEFPDLVEELDEDSSRGLVYIQLGTLARFAQAAIDRGEKTLVERCFALADRAKREGDDDVVNAVGVAFLEHLNFQNGKVRREWAFALMSPSLRAAAATLGIAEGYRRP
jgi:hypothetical protein